MTESKKVSFHEGQVFDLPSQRQPRHCRIMAIVEGYVVARFQGCMPFIETKSDFKKRMAVNLATLREKKARARPAAEEEK